MNPIKEYLQCLLNTLVYTSPIITLIFFKKKNSGYLAKSLKNIRYDKTIHTWNMLKNIYILKKRKEIQIINMYIHI